MSDSETIGFDVVRESAKRDCADRYIAALFAPTRFRDDLIAVAAFTGAIERIGREVSETPLAEIRLAWWRDALSAPFVRSGNPVLDAFANVATRHAFDASIDRYFDAQARALYAATLTDDDLCVMGGTPLLLAARVLGADFDPTTRAIIDAAGRAAAMVRIALDLPYALKHGRVAFPVMPAVAENEVSAPDWRPQIAWLASQARASLAAVRAQLAGKSSELTTALLPVALIEPYFKALLHRGHEPARDIVEIVPLARLWRIAYAHWTGRI